VPIMVLSVLGAVVAALAAYTAYDVGLIGQANPATGRFIEVSGGRLHLVETGRSDKYPVVLLHGASVNLGDMMLALSGQLSAIYRIIAVDRPGHGWSDRPGRRADASPMIQARLIRQALDRIGVIRPILVAHSWSGALAMAYALENPDDVAGLVLLAPVVYPWSVHTVAWHDNFMLAALVAATSSGAGPTSGPLFAHTLALPLSKVLMAASIKSAFAPQLPPADYMARSGGNLELRPSNFVANSQDVDLLDQHLAAQAQRYGEIQVPVLILAGDQDAVAPPKPSCPAAWIGAAACRGCTAPWCRTYGSLCRARKDPDCDCQLDQATGAPVDTDCCGPETKLSEIRASKRDVCVTVPPITPIAST
jgi:pimeloyl-ACP methyl ester carboxylesterase